jgi:hypothetical protein
VKYWREVVRSGALADLGSVFRTLSTISWQRDSITGDRWPIEEHLAWLALENLGVL